MSNKYHRQGYLGAGLVKKLANEVNQSGLTKKIKDK